MDWGTDLWDQYDGIDKHTQSGLDLVDRYPPAAEDFSHLPPEQRKKKLQSKIDDITKDLQKELDQSLEPQITQTTQNVGRLRGQLTKYEFDEDFDEDAETPIGQATALYSFQGTSEGTVSITEGEQLSVMESDKGDGWMRVQRANGDEGYIPSSYDKF
ncbi:unnamed protein product [Coregonus sp. 'balchen']|nr:unnamed protein product [Coregonus sp. 'balchen']